MEPLDVRGGGDVTQLLVMAREGDREAMDRLLPGDGPGAIRLLEEGIGLWRRGGHPTLLAWMQTNLGAYLVEQGEVERGRAAILLNDGKASHLLKKSLKIRAEIGNLIGVTECLESIAVLRVVSGGKEAAGRMLGASRAIRERLQAPLPALERAAVEKCHATARSRLGSEHLEALRRQGRELDPEDAAALGG